MQKRSRFSLALVVATAASTAGCMGSFALTKAVYGWNETVTGNKIINNVIFWALNILPVYELAVLGDVVILNTIEFWTGSKLLGDASDPAGADSRVAVIDNCDGTVTVERNGHTFVVVAESDTRVRIVKDGTDAGSAERMEDGSVVAYDASGTVIAVAPAR